MNIMKTRMNIKRFLFTTVLALAATTTFAQHRHRGHIARCGYWRPAVTTVITRPTTTVRISNRLCKNDRLEMALAYLKNNKTLSVSEYSKMTGLKKATAEAELDAFAASKKTPVRVVMSGKKKLYVA